MSETVTMTLTEFLLARIAEDQAVALKSRTRPWDEITFHDQAADDIPLISRYGPARVLAECEAKRRIVESFEDERQRRDIYNRGYDDGLLTTDDDLRHRLASNARCRGLEIAMLAHATTYADHPDFRDEWRP